MNATMRGATLGILCATLAFGDRVVLAAPAPVPGSPDEAAQQAFRAGVDAARQEHWPEALASFERAYGLSPRPVVLINLAGAQARTGRLLEAARNYHRIVEDDSSPDTAPFRKAAAEVLPPLEARIPQVRLRPSGLTVRDVIRVDEEAVPLEEMTTGHRLDPGEHTLVVQHDGAERVRILFTLAERELRYINLPLPALAPPVVAAGVPSGLAAFGGSDRAASESTPGASERAWWRSPWTWTAAAVVVVGAAVTTYVLLERRPEPFVGNIDPGRVDVH